MLLGSLRAGGSLNLLFQKLLISWIQKNIGIDAIGIRVDEINGDPQVRLSQKVMFVLFLQRSCFILNKPVLVEGVGDELGVKWDVWKAIAVFDSTDHSRPLRQSPVGIGPVAIFPLGLGLDGGRHRDQAARTASSLVAGRRGGACRLRDAGSEARPRWAPGSAGKGGMRWTGEKGSGEPRKPQEKCGQRRPRTRSCRPNSHRDADERTGSLRPQGLRKMAAPQQQASAVSSAAGVSGPGSAGGPGPQQQPQPTQLVGPGQSGLLQQQQQDFDPVQRYKMLIPQLKESLQTLMKVAAQNLIQNTNIDNGQKSSDGPIQRFDKCLEEFYALCDQLELCLRLAHECLSQSCDSAKHSPTLVPTATKPDAVQPDSLPYPQYLAVIKAQITCAKDIHTALLDCANKVTGKTTAASAGPGGSL